MRSTCSYGPIRSIGAHGARSEARAGAVGDAEIHRHADQRDVELATPVMRQSVGMKGRADEGRRIGEGPFAVIGAMESCSATALNGVVNVAASRAC